MPCPLCLNSGVSKILPGYFVCPGCDLRYLDPVHHLNASEEEHRYRQHNNDVHDPAYQQFVAPLYHLLKPRLSDHAQGLDFGAGSGPVLAHLFSKEGHPMALYDPFFWPNRACLNQRYDFIVASEVAEHFYHPRQEFQQLQCLLKPGGWLGLMTLLYEPSIDFAAWYYRRDPTHVVFYSRLTMKWLADWMGFGELTCVGERLILMRNPGGSHVEYR